MSYYNTTGLMGNPLKKAIAEAKTQEEIISNIYYSIAVIGYTPFEIEEMWPKNKDTPPITSIRRAINSLEKKGILIKTSEMREGNYGKLNNTWKLKV